MPAPPTTFSVIRNAAQPFRIPDPGKPEASQTIWQSVSDLTNKRYVYESATRPNIVWMDLKDMDFTEGSPQLKLDLTADLRLEDGLAGNVAKKFEDKGADDLPVPDHAPRVGGGRGEGCAAEGLS